MRKKQVEVFPGKIKRHAKSYWIKVGFHSGRGESPLFGLNRYVPSEKGMVFEVLSPKQGKQFHFFACGKGVSRLSRLFGKESLNYMCGINNIFLFENPSLDGVPTPCPNFRLGPPSPTSFT